MGHTTSSAVCRITALLALVSLVLSGCASRRNIPAQSPDDKSAQATNRKQASNSNRAQHPTEENFFNSLSDAPNDQFHFQSRDVVKITISGEAWGRKYRIPPSGKIDLKFIGPYKIAGKTPEQVRSELMDQLSPTYFINPDLRVNISKIAKTRVLVLGEVKKPSHVTVRRGDGIMNALAEAGSLTQYSHRTSMYLFRNLAGDTSIYKVDYEDYTAGAASHNLALKDGDLIYVQTNFWPHFDRLKDVLRPLGFTVNTLATLRFFQDL